MDQFRTVSDLGPKPINVEVTRDGSDTLISFMESLPGDYNGDGEVSGLDVFPLAAHFLEQAEETAGNECIDGNGDGALDGKDLFLIATGFQDEIRGYNVFCAEDRGGPFDELVNWSLIDYEGCSATHEFRHLSPDIDYYYAVRPAFEWAGDTEPPTWPDTVGLQHVRGSNGVVLLSWNEAVDQQSSPVEYNVYMDTESPLDFNWHELVADAVIEPGEGWDFQCRIEELDTETEYHFGVRAQDSFMLPNEERNEVQLACTPGPDFDPPEWADEAGVQYVEEAPYGVTLYWNEATDQASGPARYNVYYGLTTPWNQYTASVIERVPAQPGEDWDWKYTVTDLMPDYVYWFEVRAEDSAFPPNEGESTTPISCEAGWKMWNIEPADEPGVVGRNSVLAFDGEGRASIAYQDVSNFDLKFAVLDNEEWQVETVAEVGALGEDIAFVFGPDDVPWICYWDQTLENLMFVERVQSQWEQATVDSTVGGSCGISLVVAPNGEPALSYQDCNEADLKLAARSDGAWQSGAVVFSIYAGQDSSLAFDPGGSPAIAHIGNDGASRKLFLSVPMPNEWLSIVVTSVDGNFACNPSLGFDSYNRPCIATTDTRENRLFYSYPDGGIWVAEHPPLIMGAGDYCDLVYDDSLMPWIALHDSGNSRARLTRQIYVPELERNFWIECAVDTFGAGGGRPSLNFNPAGEPGVSFFEITLGDLLFAEFIPE